MKCYIYVLSLTLISCRCQKETVHQVNESIEMGQMIEWVTTVEYEDEKLKFPEKIDIDCKPTNKPKIVRVRTEKRVSNNASVQKSDSVQIKTKKADAGEETGLLHNCKSVLQMLGVICLALLLFKVFRWKK